jgi:hypothetical protein
MVHVKRVPSDLILANPGWMVSLIEDRRVKRCKRGTPQIFEESVANVDVGTVNEDDVPACAAGIRRTHNHVPSEISHMREKLQLAIGISSAWVVKFQCGCQVKISAGMR